MPSTSSVSLTGNFDIDGVLSGTKWTDPNLTFSFPTLLSQMGYTESGFEAMNATQQAAVRAIFQMYQSYTLLTFTEVTETSTVHGTLRFAEEDNAGTAYGYYPSAAIQGGDIWLNHTDYNTPLKGTYAYATFLHEIGHTLGLDHGQDGLAALPTDHDSLEYSVMTYRSFVGADLNGYTASQGSFPQTLMLDDIAALQYMYGANYTTNSGNTTYTWNPTTGEMSINGTGQGAPTANKIFMTLWDGGGNDTYDFSNYTTNLTVDLSPGSWTTTSSTQLASLGYGHYARGNIASAYLYNGNVASLIENANGGSGNDTITGNQANNILRGNGGDDTLAGGLGNDTIIGGDGSDTCIINANFVDCTVTYDDLTLTFSISNLLQGLDTLSGVEYVTFLDGTRAISSLVGPLPPDTTAPTLQSFTPADNSQSVAVGANLVLTFSEAVAAGDGTIVIHHANGDVLMTISANDTSQVSISGGVVTINPTSNLAAGESYYITLDSTAFHDTALNNFAGFSTPDAFNFKTASSVIAGNSNANTLNGTDGNDTINGLAGNDTLNGLGGNDIIDGGTGRDKMAGGTGDDTYYLDNSGDTVTEGSNAGTDSVYAGFSYTLGSNVENLYLTGSSAANGMGNALNNILSGNAAANKLSGGNGDDTLYGKGGIDTLTGGSGKDKFVFDTALGSVDKIVDFNATDDTIVLSKSIFAAASLNLGTLDASQFFTGASAGDASDRFIYNSSTGALYYDADGIGGAAQQQIATLSKGLALTAADFLLIA
ncbi:Ig-like domain-containing protein [Devosia sp.]|uniref:Ig-like domain-containing protein n=1 Tax=Devosia sp. TaxID=1871048 RepID=UPI003BAC05C3